MSPNAQEAQAVASVHSSQRWAFYTLTMLVGIVAASSGYHIVQDHEQTIEMDKITTRITGLESRFNQMKARGQANANQAPADPTPPTSADE
mgnify:CR=1 FL=1